MILLLLAQLAVTNDSVYSSAALRALVAHAAVENHAPPTTLRGYRAHVESELSLILRDTLGRERAGQIEQLASSAEWTRGNAYDMHVIGYRTQGLGSPISTLSFVRGWTEPTLYSERMRLGIDVSGRAAPPTSNRDTVVAVHPFASDRDRYYKYSGGDTITVLRTANRSIAIVRIRVAPQLPDSTRLAAFDGEIDVDADRHQIVRMRGRFVVLSRRAPNMPLVARLAGLTGVAYVEFVNTEVGGKYWLPAIQRTELQSTMAVMGHTRAIMRIMSTFSGYDVTDASGALAVDESRRLVRHTTWAPSDTVSRFADWRSSVGEATASVTANDFDDLAPDAWKSTGGVRIDLVPTNIDNVVRFDRIEGLFTGYQADVQMRSVVPGLSFGAHGGWAWSEQTIRGGAHVSLKQKEWILGARAERMLATTNDFIRPFDPQTGGLAAIVGSIDDFDYVDRRVALLSATRIVGSVENAIVTAQLGVGGDRAEVARLTHGWIGTGAFRPNRGVQSGNYTLGIIDAEWHPGISGDFVQPGVGARIHHEVGRGSLEWQRTELSISALHYWGSVAVLLQGDGGTVSGSSIPPQKLFELGGSGVLPGYAYKEFAGDRAALFRGFGSYSLPIWKEPHRFRNSFFIPGVSPALAVGIQGGWTQLSGDAARVAVYGLGGGAPLSHATDGVRATLGLGMTFFSGSIHAGVARPIDRSAPWRFTIGGGPAF
ncbi:MAG: hypothetical protein JWM95_965 [Gemmatimonadetes bacterium]|nr:hypothetical protein [Gemmatimonadota bacterium]